MTRLHNWEERLSKVLFSYRKTKGEYGKTDCCCFVRDTVFAITDRNVLSELPMRYTDSLSALREFVKYGGVKTPEELMDKFLGKRQPLTYAQRGDIMSIKVEEDDNALGVCLGRDSVFMNVDSGLVRFPTNECVASWRVQCLSL